MKILMTTDAVGGVWNYSLDLATGLGKSNIEIILVCLGPAPDYAQRRTVRKIPNVQFYHRPYKLEWMDDPWDDVDAAGAWLWELSNKERPDIIHLNGFVHAALPWSVPVVVVGHSCVCSWFRSVKGCLPSFLEPYRRKVREGLLAANMVVTPTQAMLHEFEEIYGPIESKQVIYNGTGFQEHHSIPKENFIFSMGRWWDEGKNIGLLLKAAPQITCPIFIAGAKPELEEPIPDHVFFLGQLAHREVLQWLERAMIYALPVRYEPFGLSFLEAAASGCALVGGDIPTLREVWDDAMVYVDPNDASQLAEACNWLMANRTISKEMVQKSINRAGEFTVNQLARDYVKIYDELLKEEMKYV